MATNRAIEFLVWLLIAASVIGVVAARLKIPYTVALVLGGLALGSLHRFPAVVSLTQGQRPDWLTPDVVLLLFLPPLLFEASINLPIGHLRENFLPILILANAGVLAATLITGYAIHWAYGLPVIIALVFGSIISATDPISVISVFKEMGVAKRLSQHVVLKLLHRVVIVVSSHVSSSHARAIPLALKLVGRLHRALLIAAMVHQEENVLEPLRLQARLGVHSRAEQGEW